MRPGGVRRWPRGAAPLTFSNPFRAEKPTPVKLLLLKASEATAPFVLCQHDAFGSAAIRRQRVPLLAASRVDCAIYFCDVTIICAILVSGFGKYKTSFIRTAC